MSDYFIFGNIDTRTYEGVSVYFDEVDTTPKRVGEFIEIPNRNGSLFLDSGRYEDVTHTYDIIALSMQNGRNLINALASKVGHHRLEDSFNTGEYYSAVFDTEVEPTVTMERDKITFKVIFTRKPQRFLTSGETAVTVANNGTLTNPTLFESSPLLEVKGYGTIGFNGYEIEIDNGSLGTVILANDASFAGSGTSISLAQGMLNTGDNINLGHLSLKWAIDPTNPLSYSWGYDSFSNTDSSVTDAERYGGIESITPQKTFSYGTASTYTNTKTINAHYNATAYTATLVTTIAYNGADTITISNTVSNVPSVMEMKYAPYGHNSTVAQTTGNSSVSLLGDPTYVDCDLGECYMINNGSAVSLNQYIDLGSYLPRLAPGANTITFNNTVTSLKFVPRWWKV